MLIRRTKTPVRRDTRDLLNATEIQYMDFGRLFTPQTCMTYVWRLLDWIKKNAWDAEYLFWDTTVVQNNQQDSGADPHTEEICASILHSADWAIEEVIHTFSDLCARDYTYTFAFDQWKTQYGPNVDELADVVKEQARCVAQLTENPRYEELYRAYAGVAGPHGISVDPELSYRLTDDDPVMIALDGIWAQVCSFLEELGPHFPSVYCGQYPYAAGIPHSGILTSAATVVMLDFDSNAIDPAGVWSVPFRDVTRPGTKLLYETFDAYPELVGETVEYMAGTQVGDVFELDTYREGLVMRKIREDAP